MEKLFIRSVRNPRQLRMIMVSVAGICFISFFTLILWCFRETIYTETTTSHPRLILNQDKRQQLHNKMSRLSGTQHNQDRFHNVSYITCANSVSVSMAEMYSASHLRRIKTQEEVARDENEQASALPINKFGVLNDDFCDCGTTSDALHTDESRTSACSSILVRKPVFHCRHPTGGALNRLFHSAHTQIYSSRVNDGVCDCPMCEDEE